MNTRNNMRNAEYHFPNNKNIVVKIVARPLLFDINTPFHDIFHDISIIIIAIWYVNLS